MSRNTRTGERTPRIGKINPFAARHGSYGAESVTAPAGDRREVLRNRGATTVERWLAAGKLTAAHMAAIEIYVGSWQLWHDEPRVVANLSPTAFIRSTGNVVETLTRARAQAKRVLDRVDGLLATVPPVERLVFRNVVLHDQSAADAAATLSASPKGAEVEARAIVRMIAGMIDLAMNRQEAACR